MDIVPSLKNCLNEPDRNYMRGRLTISEWNILAIIDWLAATLLMTDDSDPILGNPTRLRALGRLKYIVDCANVGEPWLVATAQSVAVFKAQRLDTGTTVSIGYPHTVGSYFDFLREQEGLPILSIPVEIPKEGLINSFLGTTTTVQVPINANVSPQQMGAPTSTPQLSENVSNAPIESAPTAPDVTVPDESVEDVLNY